MNNGSRRGMKVPGSKFQAPKKLQVPNSKRRNQAVLIGAYLEVGAWNLELLCRAGCKPNHFTMRTNLLRPNEANHRAELEAVHHRMMLRARTRARYGRWWWQQGRAVSARPAGSGRRAASLPM